MAAGEAGDISVIRLTMALPTMAPSAMPVRAARCFGLEMPNPTHTGRSVNRSQLPDIFGEIRRQILARAGDSRNGEIINKSGAHPGDFGSPLGGGGGRDQQNGVEPGGADLSADLVRFRRREVGNDQTGKPGRACVGEKSFGAVAEYDAIAEHARAAARIFVERIARINAKMSATFIFRARAAVKECWIVGPSAIGSENGNPISMAAAPASSTALIVAAVVSRSG